MRRVPLAFVLVGVVGILTAGAAVLGAFEAPTGNDLTVHNGAGETLQANRVEGSYTDSTLGGTVVSFVFRAPDHVSEVAVSSTGKVEGKRRISGPQASSVLGPVKKLLSITKFSANGSYFDNTQPASVLVAPSQRSGVTGTYRTRVVVQGGYVVSIDLRIDATVDSNGQRQHISETVRYRLSRVDSWKRSS